MVVRLYILACLAVAGVIGAGFQPLQMHRRAKFLSDANTACLVHFDGSNAQTDLSGADVARHGNAPHTLTVGGGAALATAQKQFGTASLYLDGDGDYLTVSDADDLDCTGLTWTIEMWLRLTAFAENNRTVLFTKRLPDGSEASYYCMVCNNNPGGFYGLRFLAFDATDTAIITMQQAGGSLDWSVDTWYHLAIVRDGATAYAFRDGTQIATATSVSGTVRNTASDLLVGKQYSTFVDLAGYVDEPRISSSARYTGAFPPPTAPFNP